jgi:transcriptional regulator EpsA
MHYMGLQSHDMEHLVVAIESSLKVHNRAQFFLWTQGPLQSFIPHETLVCAYGDVVRMRCKSEIFGTHLHGEHAENSIQDPANGLIHRLQDEWLRAGSSPLLCDPDSAEQTGRRQLYADLKRNQLGRVSCHGPREITGEQGSFFAFARMPHVPGPRDAYLLELLMPYLHMALYRMLAHTACTPQRNAVSQEVALLTKREMQVLHWVKNGKTNVEIAQILTISPPTVKHHVQRIMRKLKVTNRAQAVGKGATLRLMVPGDPQ